MFKKTVTSLGEVITTSIGVLTNIQDYNAKSLRLSFTIEGLEQPVVSYRGKSLDTPELNKSYPLYIKESDYLEINPTTGLKRGNTAWNIGYETVSDVDPFE